MLESNHRPKALGCHVFAGGFTVGMRRHVDVVSQLEIHDFGRDTVEQRIGIPFVNRDSWRDWPRPESGCGCLFGNPRCTGFSTLTSGLGDAAHGPFAKCTQDIRDLCEYGVHHEIPLIIWESVQQAMTTGRPLIDWLIQNTFAGKPYRFAHILMNAATFGNAQNRRRYFFVAYNNQRHFNVSVPERPEHLTTVWDVIGKPELLEAPAHECEGDFQSYDDNAYTRFGNRGYNALIPYLAPGEDVNDLGYRDSSILRRCSASLAIQYEFRTSDIPFGLHSPKRLEADRQCPTLHSGSRALIHPTLNRPITVREMALLMGWPHTPLGPKPMEQIVKGICVHVGEWMGEQVAHYFNDDWRLSNFELKATKTNLIKTRVVAPLEKTFDLTEYT